MCIALASFFVATVVLASEKSSLIADLEAFHSDNGKPETTPAAPTETTAATAATVEPSTTTTESTTTQKPSPEPPIKVSNN